MLIKVPLVYTAEAVRKGTRAVREETFGEFVNVVIYEPSEEEAPVAMRWEDPIGTLSTTGVAETRWFDGRHFRPLLAEYLGHGFRHVSSDRFEKEVRRGLDRDGTLVKGQMPAMDFLEGHIPAFDPEHFSKISRHARNNAISDLRSRARDAIIINGMTWIACGEPVYEISRREGEGTTLRPLIISARPGARPDNSVDLYRADRFEDAMAAMQARGDCADISAVKIEVLVRDSLRYDDERHSLIESALAACRLAGIRQESQKEEKLVMSYSGLRAAIQEARHSWSDETAEALVTSFDRYRKHFPDGGKVDQGYAAAIKRWNDWQASMDAAAFPRSASL